ncbi:protein kinase [Bacteroidota bacterium]
MIGKTISHYKILEKLGAGGMGVVYKARDTKLDRYVALKFLPPLLSQAEEEKKRFIHEAKAASALDHPNICSIYEIDKTKDGQMFIAMACYEGETLKDKIKNQTSQEGEPANRRGSKFKEVVDIAVQIAKGLKKAHEKGIIHRDIKPANIFITEDGFAKILDFGLAKLAGSGQLTKSGMTLGTVSYMSPEQAKNEIVDQRTDIWSLGVMLYEMLSGQLPFKGDYEPAIMYTILNEEPKPVTHVQTGTPIEINAVLNRSLSKNVDERYQNMDDLLADLGKVKNKISSEVISTERSDQKSSPSVAVLPFVNTSADPEQEYFCDGMAEEIINALSHIKELKVVARTSAFSFKGKDTDIKEIGKKLKVDKVLEGSVRKARNRLRITAQLINVEDGYHLWSERYDRDLDDVFAIQDEVTTAIVDRMKVNLLGEEKQILTKRSTDNPEAYQFYLKGRYFSNKRTPEGNKKAIEFFNKSIEIDPKFALSYTGLAFLYIALGVFGLHRPKDVFPKARSLNEKALEIDKNLAPAHSVKAYVNLFYDWNWSAAERVCKKAIELNPGDTYSYLTYALYLDSMGRFEKAIGEMKKAVNLDPLSLIINADMGLIYHCARRYEEAIRWFRKTLDIEPHYGLAFHHMAVTYAVQENYEEAEKCFKKAIKLTGGLPWSVGWLSYVYFKLGKRAKAKSLIQELHNRSKKEYIHPSCFILPYLELEGFDKAFEYWDVAYEEREPLCCMLKVLPELDRFRSDARFDELLEKMNLK